MASRIDLHQGARPRADYGAAMKLTDELLARYDTAIPRYTSYPTAPHFSPAVGADEARAWYADLPADMPLSLYVHIPFCDTLCWFCGCNTKIVRQTRPVTAYLETLLAEIDLTARLLDTGSLDTRRPVHHLHFGGGSPTILQPDEVRTLMARIRERFDVVEDAEIAVEIDPRGFDEEHLNAWHDAGINRASLGVQDIDPRVQDAINRIQSTELNHRVIGMLRDAGVTGVNVDLIYGLPYQTVEGIERTAAHAAELGADRVAIFGYAHVPWMKTHQRRVAEHPLPGREDRFAMQEAAAAALVAAGYRRIGLDHFAKPEDSLTRALDAGALNRNFQGYTADPCPALIGLGASSIGSLPRGYLQNEPSVRAWRRMIEAGEPPIARGIAIDDEDRLRRAIIERLMCDLDVDAGALADRFGVAPESLIESLDALASLAADGLCEIDGWRVRVPEHARPLIRNVAAAFDAYHAPSETRHARAV